LKKDDISLIVNNPQMIAGIYNYCDRWCERCEFTQKCANHAINEDYFSSNDELDINNKQFWANLSELFKVTKEMVLQAAKEQGIDLYNIEHEKIDRSYKKVDDKIKKLECSRMSDEYIGLVKDWFDSNETLLTEKCEELLNFEDLDLENNNPGGELEKLNEIIEIIRWYHYQINVKIRRAGRGKNEDDFEVEDEFPKDSDGSAKVALIGIDRSIAAWGVMLTLIPEEEDNIFTILVHLERLRRITETEFPSAREFIRPGFDS
jgi:hypothetical protein